MIGRTISHYQIVGQIGAGGMGVVYEAEDKILKRRVAIKTLKDLNSQKSRLLREAQAISHINHPHIATVYDYGETEEGQPFIIMELVKGKPLDEFIKNDCISLSQIINIIIKVADALSTAHKYGIIHRDIKPSNILIADNENVKVLDFGLSKQVENTTLKNNPAFGSNSLEATRTQKGVILGTPLYLSPEQALGKKVDVRSDIFSLGTLLYESITGKLPFYADTVIEICAKILRDNPPLPSQINPAIPASLDKITLKALAKEPKHRYQNVSELISDLQELQKHLPKEEKLISSPPSNSKSSISQRLYTSFRDVLRYRFSSALVFLAMAFTGLALFFYWQANHAVYQPLPAAEMWYEKGERALNDGLFFAAKKCFEQATALDGNFVMAHARHAETLFELGFTENARQERERTNEIISSGKIVLSSQDNLRRQAINNTLLFDYKSALKNYQELTQSSSYSNKAQAYLDLGRAYERNENLPEAVESYQKSLDYNANAAANLRLGVLYGRQQDYEKSAAFFAAAERLYKIQNVSEGEIEVSYQRGLHLSNRGDATKAQAEIENSLKKAEINGIPNHQIKCLLLMSRILRYSGKSQDALPFANQAISLAQQNNIDNLHAQGFLELGTVYFFLSKHEDAKNSYDEALRLARQYHATLIEKRILLQFGAFYVQQHRADESLDYINQVQNFFEAGGYKKDMLDLLSIKAQATTIKGDFQTALDTYRDLFARAEEVGDYVQKARSQKGIATLLANQDDLSNSLSPMYQSYAIYNSINKTLEAGYSLLAYADILCQLGRYEETNAALNQAEGLAVKHNSLSPGINLIRAKKALSERYFDNAVKIAQQIIVENKTGKIDITIETKLILALSYVQSGQKSQAKKIISEVLAVAVKNEDSRIVAFAYLVNAEILLENNQAPEALESAIKAQEMFHQFGKVSFEWRAWLLICLAQKQLQNNTAANQAAASANAFFSTLSQKWKNEDFKSYSERNDVKFYRERLVEASTRR